MYYNIYDRMNKWRNEWMNEWMSIYNKMIINKVMINNKIKIFSVYPVQY